MEGLDDVRMELEAKRQNLSLELDELKGQYKALEKDLKRVDDAIGALTKSRTKSRRTRKPAVNLEEMRSFFVAAREEFPFIEGKELEQAVREQAKTEGKSLTGFADLYSQVLGEQTAVQEHQNHDGQKQQSSSDYHN